MVKKLYIPKKILYSRKEMKQVSPAVKKSMLRINANIKRLYRRIQRAKNKYQ